MAEPDSSRSPSRKRARVETEGFGAPGAKKSRDSSVADSEKRTKKKRSKSSKRKRKASITAPMTQRTAAESSPKRIALGKHSISLSDEDNTDQEDIEMEVHPQAGPSKHTEQPPILKLEPSVEPEIQQVKGKYKETVQMPSDEIREDSDSRVAAFEKQLEEKTKLLSKHQTALTQVQSNITCQICLDLMYKPFALAPCGHLACYNCLVSWFKAPPSNNQEHAPPVMSRRKTCPHCRAVIRDRPTEVWDVKSIVLTLSKSGLLDVEGTHNTANDPIPADPWEGIFRPVHPRGHNIFHGFFPDHEPAPPAPGAGGPTMGMYDAEDGGVYRCLDCMHEIFRGRCTSCGRTYPGHHDFDEDDEDDYEDMPYDTEDDLSELDDPIIGGGWPYHMHELYGDEDEDEDDHMYDLHDPFIDDMGAFPEFHGSDDEASTEELTNSDSDEGSPSGAFIVELDSEGNEIHEDDDHDHSHTEGGSHDRHEEEEEEEDMSPPRRLATSRRQIAIESDSDSQEEQEDEEISYAPTRLRYRRLLFADQDEDDEDDGSVPGPASRLQVYLDDNTEDDDGDNDGTSSGGQSEQEEDDTFADYD